MSAGLVRACVSLAQAGERSRPHSRRREQLEQRLEQVGPLVETPVAAHARRDDQPPQLAFSVLASATRAPQTADRSKRRSMRNAASRGGRLQIARAKSPWRRERCTLLCSTQTISVSPSTRTPQGQATLVLSSPGEPRSSRALINASALPVERATQITPSSTATNIVMII